MFSTSSTRRAVVVAIALCLGQWPANAFTIETSVSPSSSRYTGDTSRYATIYAPDGGSYRYDEEEDKQTLTSTLMDFGVNNDGWGTPDMLELLATNYRGALARLACAFAPPGHSMKLSNINNVLVLAVTKTSITISAVLCDRGECVTVAVPVDFPISCECSDDMTGCVVQNINELNFRAEPFIVQMEQQEETKKSGMASFERIIADHELEYPSWWAQPGQLAEDCRVIRDLLSEEDFRIEVQALTSQVLTRDYGHEHVVGEAKVLEVGPAGFYVRAQAQRLGDGIIQIVDVPVPFKTTARSVDELHSLVLEAVEAVASASH